jgi:hypothetical protein
MDVESEVRAKNMEKPGGYSMYIVESGYSISDKDSV